MTTKRNIPKSSKPASVAIRINGRAVSHAAGAKLAAEWLGCTQTTGPQAGQGSVLQMVEAIGAGDVAQFGVDDLRDPRVVGGEIDALCEMFRNRIDITNYIAEPDVLRALDATAAALRNAARLREASEK